MCAAVSGFTHSPTDVRLPHQLLCDPLQADAVVVGVGEVALCVEEGVLRDDVASGGAEVRDECGVLGDRGHAPELACLLELSLGLLMQVLRRLLNGLRPPPLVLGHFRDQPLKSLLGALSATVGCSRLVFCATEGGPG